MTMANSTSEKLEPQARRRLEIALGYIKRAANRELPKLPCRVDEMAEREVAIFNVCVAATGNLQFIARELDAMDSWLPSPASSPVPPEQKSTRYKDRQAHYAAIAAANDSGRCGRQPWACRYQNARQCAHDSMLGAECPKVCGCECHNPAATPTPVEQEQRWRCACGWCGTPSQMTISNNDLRSCPNCGGSGGLILDALESRKRDKCEHGVLWSMECLSCGPSDFVAATAAPSVREAAEQIPKTTYKNKRQLSDDERFKLNRALNDYTFNNCDHEHDGYPNHLACRWCALEIIAAITCSPVSAAGGDEDGESLRVKDTKDFAYAKWLREVPDWLDSNRESDGSILLSSKVANQTLEILRAALRSDSVGEEGK